MAPPAPTVVLSLRPASQACNACLKSKTRCKILKPDMPGFIEAQIRSPNENVCTQCAHLGLDCRWSRHERNEKSRRKPFQERMLPNEGTSSKMAYVKLLSLALSTFAYWGVGLILYSMSNFLLQYTTCSPFTLSILGVGVNHRTRP